MNGWVNNRDDDDLRQHRALYDAIVIQLQFSALSANIPSLKTNIQYYVSMNTALEDIAPCNHISNKPPANDIMVKNNFAYAV